MRYIGENSWTVPPFHFSWALGYFCKYLSISLNISKFIIASRILGTHHTPVRRYKFLSLELLSTIDSVFIHSYWKPEHHDVVFIVSGTNKYFQLPGTICLDHCRQSSYLWTSWKTFGICSRSLSSTQSSNTQSALLVIRNCISTAGCLHSIATSHDLGFCWEGYYSILVTSNYRNHLNWKWNILTQQDAKFLTCCFSCWEADVHITTGRIAVEWVALKMPLW